MNLKDFGRQNSKSLADNLPLNLELYKKAKQAAKNTQEINSILGKTNHTPIDVLTREIYKGSLQSAEYMKQYGTKKRIFKSEKT